MVDVREISETDSDSPNNRDASNRRRLFTKLVGVASLGLVTSLLLGERTEKVSATYGAENYGDVFFDDGSGRTAEAMPVPFFHWDNNNYSLGVGVADRSPQATLDVRNTEHTSLLAGTTPMTAQFAGAQGTNWSHIHYGLTGDWYIRSASSSGNVIIQDSGGNVGIGTGTPAHLLDLAGGAYCDGTGSWIAGSSVRWKENIEPLTDGLGILKQLHPVAYNRKETPQKRTMGFIAEEVGKVLPTVVDWDREDPTYAEGYDHLAILALTVVAVKELTVQNKRLESQNEMLTNRIVTLERKIGSS
jgi:hypothetical protein